MKKKIIQALKIIGIIWLLSIIISSMFSYSNFDSGNIAVIPIYGEITTIGSKGFTVGASAEKIIADLDEAYNNPNIEAIILDINSPGGSGVAADEISQKIKGSEKLTVAVIRDYGTSAAYWIASSSDHVYANRLSLTGSIGVIGSFLDFSGFIQEYNITYQRYVSGELKDMGSAFKQPSTKEKEIYQKLIDDMQNIFIEEVAMNRNLTISEVEKMATGQIYLGIEAKELGLVDELGTKEDAVEYIETQLNITSDLVRYEEKINFMDLLSMKTGEMGKFINPGSSILFK